MAIEEDLDRQSQQQGDQRQLEQGAHVLPGLYNDRLIGLCHFIFAHVCLQASPG